MFTLTITVKSEAYRSGFVLMVVQKTFALNEVAINKTKNQIEVLSKNAEGLASIIADIIHGNAHKTFEVTYLVKNC